MNNSELWSRILIFLRAAKTYIILIEHNEQEFESWVDRNEYELAWDSLYDNAIVNPPFERQFLLRMLQAATIMGLDIKAAKIFDRLK